MNKATIEITETPGVGVKVKVDFEGEQNSGAEKMARLMVTMLDHLHAVSFDPTKDQVQILDPVEIAPGRVFNRFIKNQ